MGVKKEEKKTLKTDKTEKISKLSIDKLNKNLNDIKFMKENASEIHKELQFFQL